VVRAETDRTRKDGDVTPIIVVAALAALIVIGALLVLMSRSRRDDEGEQFRRVADLTSRWSRQVQPGQPGQPVTPVSERGVSVIGSEQTTESVDPT
jgi:hypothetical protein